MGGFGQSEYLRHEVLDEFASGSCEVTVIDAPAYVKYRHCLASVDISGRSKAAADGAVIWAAKLAIESPVTRVA